MTALNALKKDSTIGGEERDSVGGFILDTDAYDFTIDMAYMDKSKGGALSVNFLFTSAEGRSYKETIYVTNKKGENFYDKGQGKMYLPGFLTVDAIATLAIGQSIGDLTTEPKTINVYDYDAKKELPKERDVIMDLLGKHITLGIQRQKVDKTKNDGTGNYVPTGEFREQNEITKAFRTSDKLTTSEVTAEATEHAFYDKWIQTFQGKINDKSTGSTTGATNGVPGAGGNAGGTKSLFNG